MHSCTFAMKTIVTRDDECTLDPKQNKTPYASHGGVGFIFPLVAAAATHCALWLFTLGMPESSTVSYKHFPFTHMIIFDTSKGIDIKLTLSKR